MEAGSPPSARSEVEELRAFEDLALSNSVQVTYSLTEHLLFFFFSVEHKAICSVSAQ